MKAKTLSLALVMTLLGLYAATTIFAQSELNLPSSPDVRAPGSLPTNSNLNQSAAAPLHSESRRGGIREVIDDRYKKKYERWKHEFLMTRMGRRQWESFAQHPSLLLTITVSPKQKSGAITRGYRWSSGRLTEVTITLGDRIDQAYPVLDFYPVINALGKIRADRSNLSDILAAAVIAHEFGHVFLASELGELYETQDNLIIHYDSIFLTNGYNTDDPRLTELEQQLRRSPVEIRTERECYAEANALLYLSERIADRGLRRSVIRGVGQRLDYGNKPCGSLDLKRIFGIAN